NGVTTYARTLTTAVNGATSADILPTMQTSGTVAITGGATYTYDATAKSYTGTETARSQANTLTSITPAAGTTASATIKLGTASTNVNVDSNGTITAADGSALYLDASNNLTATGSGTTVAATLANVLDVTNGMSTVGDSITFNATGTKYTAGVIGTTGNNTYNVTGELASESVVAASIAKTGGTITDTATLGTSYTISAGGVSSNAFMGASGLTKTAAETLFLNANGVVTDSTANKVYADSTNPGKLTIKAASDSTATVDPLKALDAALSKVDGLRGTLGAVQNRFDSVIANLGTTITNLTSSRSRIEDADYATEVSNMTRAQILQQAGTSVLAKANQSTQGVMALLQ
ncbi:MAG: flagellin FliC, partial [Comamonadaceae bacterium CG_4_10_14_3_um_filter_60_42]